MSPPLVPYGSELSTEISAHLLGAKALNLLRVPEQVELAGLDTHELGDALPYQAHQETAFEAIERTHAKDQ